MTENEQRTAFLTACGWKPKEKVRCGEWILNRPSDDLIDQPDCLRDQNVIHEAVRALDHTERQRFTENLLRVVGYVPENRLYQVEKAVNATAAQRLEAFLRVKGLWKD